MISLFINSRKCFNENGSRKLLQFYQTPPLASINKNSFNRNYCNIRLSSPSVLNNTSTFNNSNGDCLLENKHNIIKNNQKEFLTMLTTNIKTIPKYVSSSQFIVEKSLDPILIKTKKPEEPIKAKNRYIIVGLGNPGEEYINTKHNIGFLAIDHLCELLDCKLDQDVKSSLYTTVYLKLDEKLSSSQKSNNRFEKKQQHSKQLELIKNQFVQSQIQEQQEQQQSSVNNSSNNKISQEDSLMMESEEINLNSIKKPKKVVNQVIILKPMTYMNCSGNPIRTIQTKYNVPIENILVLVDDISNELGVIKMRTKGGSAGQKGIESVISRLGTEKFSRIKFGVGIPQPGEVRSNFVMKKLYNSKEKEILFKNQIDTAIRFSFMWLERGSDFTMNQINK